MLKRQHKNSTSRPSGVNCNLLKSAQIIENYFLKIVKNGWKFVENDWEIVIVLFEYPGIIIYTNKTCCNEGRMTSVEKSLCLATKLRRIKQNWQWRLSTYLSSRRILPLTKNTALSTDASMLSDTPNDISTGPSIGNNYLLQSNIGLLSSAQNG